MSDDDSPRVAAKDAPPRLKPPWIVATAIRGTDQLRTLLAGGAPIQASTTGEALRGILSLVNLGGIGLSAGTLSAATNCAGFCPPDALSATVVLSSEGGGSVNGAQLERGAILLFAPGTYYEGWSSKGYRWISCFIPRDEAASIARSATGAPRRLRDARVLRSRVSTRQLDSIEEFARDVDLWRTRRTPDPLDAEAATAQAAFWRDLVTRAWAEGTSGPPRGIERRHEDTLREADRYLRAHLAEPIYLADVARAIGRPARTLEYTFRRRLGITPLAYLQWLRLWEARTHLFRSAGRSAATIARCARAVGLGHPGRFAAAYRRTFGELPHDTIVVAHERRRAVGSRPAAGNAARRPDFAFEMIASANPRPSRWVAT